MEQYLRIGSVLAFIALVLGCLFFPGIFRVAGLAATGVVSSFAGAFLMQWGKNQDRYRASPNPLLNLFRDVAYSDLKTGYCLVVIGLTAGALATVYGVF